MNSTGLVPLCSLPLLALGTKFKGATPGAFTLYGYGPGIGGFSLFYTDGEFAFRHSQKDSRLTSRRIRVHW